LPFIDFRAFFLFWIRMAFSAHSFITHCFKLRF
jgi:hypothetical protein